MPALAIVKRVVHVPDTWEGWVMRVMTIALVMVFVALYFLFGKLASLEDYITESRQQRTGYQQQELARQCALLYATQTLTAAELEDLQC
jgi:hypothetical protein